MKMDETKLNEMEKLDFNVITPFSPEVIEILSKSFNKTFNDECLNILKNVFNPVFDDYSEFNLKDDEIITDPKFIPKLDEFRIKFLNKFSNECQAIFDMMIEDVYYKQGVTFKMFKNKLNTFFLLTFILAIKLDEITPKQLLNRLGLIFMSGKGNFLVPYYNKLCKENEEYQSWIEEMFGDVKNAAK